MDLCRYMYYVIQHFCDVVFVLSSYDYEGLCYTVEFDLFLSVTQQSKIEKVPRGIRGEKSSKDMASSRNLVSTIGALASPKMGDGTRCPEG